MVAKKRTVRYFVAPRPAEGTEPSRFAVVQEYRYRGSKGIALLFTYADKAVADQVSLLLNGAKRSET
jgi:hypothetical protein